MLRAWNSKITFPKSNFENFKKKHFFSFDVQIEDHLKEETQV